ncbi:protein TIFY 10B-like protein [Carex littledalei]|uniref:Protein TIFY n=1 Tax=Carex littledalei TaxID=544730 RepID=A0A833QJ05_9POAL|nr:protein TIFY 10B-like protein [Carex littledalei]
MAAKSGEKTNFTVACGLLSQLVKEKGSIVNLNLGNNEVYRRPTTTMSLLPGAYVPSGEIETESESFEASGNKINFVPLSNKIENPEMELFPHTVGLEGGKSTITGAREQEKSQLTIFYGGKVLVFDNFPAEKVQDLMNYAIKGNPTSCNSTYIPASSSPTPTPSIEQSKVSPTTANPIVGSQIQAQRSSQPILSDLPIMRKASLQRFLEKRKDRIIAKAPYQVSNSPMTAAIKKEDTESWLGLGTKVTNV